MTPEEIAEAAAAEPSIARVLDRAHDALADAGEPVTPINIALWLAACVAELERAASSGFLRRAA